MNITEKRNGKALILAVEGRLDTTTSPELESAIKQNADGIDKLELDFSQLDYISSAGLRVLLSAHKVMAAKAGMTIKNVNKEVFEIFEITGFSDILDIIRQ